jgi:hypothetical protein
MYICAEIRSLQHEEGIDAFLQPVSLHLIPSYGREIPVPIDLTLILRRVVSGYYRSIAALRCVLHIHIPAVITLTYVSVCYNYMQV